VWAEINGFVREHRIGILFLRRLSLNLKKGRAEQIEHQRGNPIVVVVPTGVAAGLVISESPTGIFPSRLGLPQLRHRGASD
jgi:hypothetical protein